MKILAVRGENVASLAGKFELDFASGALAHTGLFAITGPTGSGKSSLLDAICLALFDATPRLSMDSGIAKIGYGDDDGGEHIQSNDVRALLTRGAGVGHAEVDFKGVDGQRYRARWDLRRARKNAGGRLQKQELSLKNLDTENDLSETKKRDTLGIIKEKLGLDFDQFRRAVLLAQGDFAAFLKANAKERGELLERMTGTDIYARISRTAFSKAKDERIALSKLCERLENVSVLEDEERKKLDEQIEELSKSEKTRGKQLKVLEGESEWYAQRHNLHEKVAESEALLVEQLAGWAAFENEGWRAPAFEEPKAVERFASAVRPQLKKATEIDALLGGAQEAVKTAHAHEEELGKARGTLAGELEAAREKAAKTEKEQGELTVWLKDNADTERLAKDWALYNEKLDAHARADAKLGELSQRAKVLAASQPVAAKELGEHEKALADAQKELKTAKKTSAAAETQLAKIPIGDLRAQREVGRTKTELLDALRGLIGEREETLTSLAAQASAKTEAEQAAKALRDAGIVLEAKLEQTVEDLKRARATLNLDDHRHELVVAEPCPLCGSTHHPYAVNDPGARSLVSKQEGAIKKLEKERNDTTTAHAKQEAAVTTAANGIANGDKTLDGIATKAAGFAAKWQKDAGDGASALPAVDGDGAPEQVDRLLSGLAAANQKLDAEIAQFDVVSKLVGEARAAQDACQREVDASGKAADGARRRVAELKSEADKIASERKSAKQTHSDSLKVLGKVFDGDAWKEELLAEPESYIAGCKTRVDAWGAKRDALEACNKRLPAEKVLGDEKKGALKKLDAACKAAGKELGKAQTKLTDQQSARKALFVGRPTDEVEEALVAIEKLETQRTERSANLSQHDSKNEPKRSAEELEPELEAQREQAKAVRQQLDGARGVQSVDDDARKRRAELGPEIEAQRTNTERWANLDGLIGSATGAKFREFAQGLTLRIVLEFANQQLSDLRPRYSLEAVPHQSLEVQVVDHDMGDERRPIASLSGGETFLVSLALALGLAESSGGVTQVESLFIDEGFGTLDGDTLEVAIAALDALQASGRTIGLISHVDGIADRLGVQVKVSPVGGGRSQVEVLGA